MRRRGGEIKHWHTCILHKAYRLDTVTTSTVDAVYSRLALLHRLLDAVTVRPTLEFARRA